MDMSRCLLAEAKVDKKFWPEVVKTAAYLKNRSLANTIEKKTPYGIFFGKKPNVKNLRLYGSKIFVRTPEESRKTKWDKKAKLGILLGYAEIEYRVLIDNKIIVARHVDIIEEDVRCIGFQEEEEKEEKYTSDEQSELEPEEESIKEAVKENQGNTEKSNLRRSTRERRAPARYPIDEYISNIIYVNNCNAITPNTFEEAIRSNEAQDWKIAMDK